MSFYEDGVIVVGDSPNSVFDALLFWAGKDWVTIPDTEDGYRSYHVECTDSEPDHTMDVSVHVSNQRV